ncbi:hypothetical protein K227x_53990 [Rubripirellula lacrimiformis]|uniref:Uncharacterized protein n=1 Tax=Rubripirellula lacrimiformis TaxID=1930273 RepID=A0A517NIL1_9BACT|nr:hypothetical protein K227x_53990 [Rubripirellula lacrimiformis]
MFSVKRVKGETRTAAFLRGNRAMLVSLSSLTDCLKNTTPQSAQSPWSLDSDKFRQISLPRITVMPPPCRDPKIDAWSTIVQDQRF